LVSFDVGIFRIDGGINMEVSFSGGRNLALIPSIEYPAIKFIGWNISRIVKLPCLGEHLIKL
jgi:hypothetical protein